MANPSSKKLHEAGVALFRKEKFNEALQKFNEAIEAAADDNNRAAQIYNDVGVTHKQLGDYEAAHAALDEAMNRFVTLDDTKGQAQTLGNRASVYEAEELMDEAIDAYKQSAHMFEALGENEMAMYVWQAISRLRKSQGRYIEAIGAYEEGVDNMPESSFKRKIMQKLLRMPGTMLGGGGSSDSNDDDEELEESE